MDTIGCNKNNWKQTCSDLDIYYLNLSTHKEKMCLRQAQRYIDKHLGIFALGIKRKCLIPMLN